MQINVMLRYTDYFLRFPRLYHFRIIGTCYIILRLTSRHAMTRKKRNIGVQRTEWLSFQQLWTPRQTSKRHNNYIYVPPNYAHGSVNDSNSKHHRGLPTYEKLQSRTSPRKDREFNNTCAELIISWVEKSRCSYHARHLHLGRGNWKKNIINVKINVDF